MALILCIDTSINIASISLANDGFVIAKEINTDSKSHGSFIQNAIAKVFADAEKKLQEVDVIAVVNGPGSYTGLRVGLSTAKGLCFALNKPLVLLNTLELLAQTVINQSKSIETVGEFENVLFCPMIDARRMEVFSAIYDVDLNVVIPPAAVILTPSMFDHLLDKFKMVVMGNGHQKLKEILTHSKILYIEETNIINTIPLMAEKFICENRMADLAYCEPFYIKDVYFAEKSKI